RIERPILDLEGEVVEPLAPAGEEAFNEAPGTRALDQLELEVADEEVGPGELAIVARPRLDPHADRQGAPEEVERRRDRGNGDRDVIDAKGREPRQPLSPGRGSSAARR